MTGARWARAGRRWPRRGALVAAVLQLGLVACGFSAGGGRENPVGLGTPAPSTLSRGFDAHVAGAVMAQPVLAAGTLVVATEANAVYGLDPVSGQRRWSRGLGPAWPASSIGCRDVGPTIGVTSTPAVDPVSGTVYLTSKTYTGGDPHQVHWLLHALDPRNGSDLPGFPVDINEAVGADGQPRFVTFTAAQESPPVLLGGRVYLAFGEHCGIGPARGYVVGVDTRSARISAFWQDEPDGHSGGAVDTRQPGLLVTGPDTLLVSTGSGSGPGGGTTPGSFGNSALRLTVAPDGRLSPAGVYSPARARAAALSGTAGTGLGPVRADPPLGRGLAVSVDRFGVTRLLALPTHPAGTPTPVSTLAEARPTQRVEVAPGIAADGTRFFVPVVNGGLREVDVGRDTGGHLVLADAASSDTDGPGEFGTGSGSPVVDNGALLGVPAVWVVRMTGLDTATGGSRGTAALQAYSSFGVDGTLRLLWSVDVSNASAFSAPTLAGGRVYLGTADGQVLAFGRADPLRITVAGGTSLASPLGRSGGTTLTLTGSAPVTVRSVSLSGGAFTVGRPRLPAVVGPREGLTLRLRFTPSRAGRDLGQLRIATSAGTVTSYITGLGQRAEVALRPSAVVLDAGGEGGQARGAVLVTNQGNAAMTVVSFGTTGTGFRLTVPARPFTIPGGATTALPVVSTSPGTPAANLRGTVWVATTEGTISVGVTGRSVPGQS
jgi:outer membrane protein assembly factor BamB